MIVEHSFVTTLAAPEAFNQAEALLASLRFRARVPAPGNGEDPSGGATREWSRGVADGRRPRSLCDRTTRVRMDFDRGRVTLAVSIAEERAAKLFAPLAVSIATALDLLLAQRRPVDAARAQTDAIDWDLRRTDRRRRTVALTVLGVVVAGITALICAAAAHAH